MPKNQKFPCRVKSAIIQDIASEFHDIPFQEVAYATSTVIELISSALISGDRVEIRGFGSFSLRYYQPRRAHNPKTGEKVATFGRYRPYFKPGKELKQRVNDTYINRIHTKDSAIA